MLVWYLECHLHLVELYNMFALSHSIGGLILFLYAQFKFYVSHFEVHIRIQCDLYDDLTKWDAFLTKVRLASVRLYHFHVLTFDKCSIEISHKTQTIYVCIQWIWTCMCLYVCVSGVMDAPEWVYSEGKHKRLFKLCFYWTFDWAPSSQGGNEKSISNYF